jgi:hypothetical protein
MKQRTRRSKRNTRKKRGGGLLTVRFAEGLASRNYPLYRAQDTPIVSWPQQGLITLICWDPDAAQSSWLHWLVINCQGTGPESGTTLVPWAPPSPPSGTHRYIFSIYTSKNPIHPETPARPDFDPATFLTANGLTQLDWVAIKASQSKA